jgi:aminoglycoside phosphotransferase family enzyme/predicted kinase
MTRMSDDPQSAIFAFLADPATHGGAKPTRIDTHAAAVFLAGERAWKVKRAVKFPFLDFSTLRKRRAALDAEVEANKPFAPQLYLGVRPITRSGGKFAIAGDGETVEWALEMRRFDETQTLDHLAAAGKIDTAMAAALARTVAAAHGRAPRVNAAPWIAALGDYLEQNAEAFSENGQVFPATRAKVLDEESHAALARATPLLQARGKAGLIRRGHGDLHLGNIALIDGAPLPFDALEFDPLVASGDLLYDLAFLLMDLAERKLADAANTVLNVYLAETRRDSDLDALAALPLFLSLRAAIRAKVTAARLANAGDDKRRSIAADAATYFAFACDLIAPPRPRLIAVGGLSGTGKSVLARMLAPHIAPVPGAVVLRSDVERKVMLGVAETEKLPSEAYGAEVTQRVYAALADKARRVIDAGHSAIVDAVFARAAERATIEALAREHGYNFRGLFLTADLATRVQRVGARVNDASDADATIAQSQESYDLGTLTWNRVDASGSPQQTLANARAALAP